MLNYFLRLLLIDGFEKGEKPSEEVQFAEFPLSQHP
jgi:hypothetical protein